MSDDVMERLRRADPARPGTPLSEEHRMRLLAAAAARRTEASAAVVPSRWRAPRRAVLFAAVLTLACAGAGMAAVVLSGESGHQVRRDYVEVTRQVPLPRGYRWPGADAPETVGGVSVVYAGRNAALMQATLYAVCAWWDAWLRAHARGDAAGMRAALRGHREVMALIPRHRPSDSEDAGGADASLFTSERRLVAEARTGRAGDIAARQAANCTGPATPRFGR